MPTRFEHEPRHEHDHESRGYKAADAEALIAYPPCSGTMGLPTQIARIGVWTAEGLVLVDSSR